jgi:purine-nucleoside phosphorylase
MKSMVDLNFKYNELLEFFNRNTPFTPDLSIILGSGLGTFAGKVKTYKTFDTADLPGYPHSTIPGHKGQIHFAEEYSKKLLLFQGRIHIYEGYSISECILPAFLSFKLGCKRIFISNAAGGINKDFSRGDLMLAGSLIGINIKKELTHLLGITSLEGKNKFHDFPSGNFNALIRTAAAAEKLNLKEGVYWYNKGPSYETPAEIGMIKNSGGDAAGMSTYHEAVMAAYLGMETSVVSCITNLAAGISVEKLTHSDVTKTALEAEEKFGKLLKAVIKIC